MPLQMLGGPSVHGPLEGLGLRLSLHGELEPVSDSVAFELLCLLARPAFHRSLYALAGGEHYAGLVLHFQSAASSNVQGRIA